MNIARINKSIQQVSLVLFASGLAFSLALANIGWVLFLATLLADYIFLKKEFVWRPSAVDMPIIAGVIVFIVSSLLGVRPMYSLSHISTELLFVVFYVCWYGFDRKQALKLVALFAAVTAAASLFGLIQYMVGIDLDLQGTLHHIPRLFENLPDALLRACALKQGRIMSTRGHPLTFAEVAYFGFICSLAMMLIEKKTVRKSLWLTASAVTLAAIIFSYSRGAWLAIAAGTPVLFIVKKKKIIRVRYVVIAIILIAGGMFAHPQLRERVLSLDAGSRDSIKTRISLWKTGIIILRDYPLFGIGPANLKQVYDRYRQPDIPDKRTWSELHNQYLHIAAERGMAGISVYLWFLAAALAMLYYSWKSRMYSPDGQLAAAGLACFAGFVVMSLTENAFFDSEVNLILWFILGATARVEQQ